MTVVWFVVLVGVLVFVHELGHFAWAKFFGVKVLTFSLGFGPRVVGVRRGETEYVIGLFPLGGYVRLLGELPSDLVAPEDAGRAFSDQSLWKRGIIVLAGPAMNLLFPLLLYFVVFLGHRTLTPATVGAVAPDFPAEGRLAAGDRILSIDGEEITTLYELNRIVEPRADVPLEIEVERGDERVTTIITPRLEESVDEMGIARRVGRLGFSSAHPLAIIGVISPSSPAAASRLRTFDRVVAAGGRPIERWTELAAILEDNRGSMVPVTYVRPVRLDGLLTQIVELDLYEPHVATLTPEPGPGSGLVRAGLEPADLYVATVLRGSPAHQAGLRTGDRLVSLDRQPLRSFAAFRRALLASEASEHELAWRHGDQEITRRVSFERERGTTEIGEPFERWALGIEQWMPTTVDEPVPNPAPFSYAVSEAFTHTWAMMEVTVVSFLHLVQGRLPVSTISGPIGMYEVTEQATSEGPLTYLSLMAFISINLGLLNLLPIPVLDGGQLLFALIEALTRRPIAKRVRQVAWGIGLALVLALAVVAFKNDVERQVAASWQVD